MNNPIAIDTETTGSNPFHGAELFMVSGCDVNGEAQVFDFTKNVDISTREVHHDRPTCEAILEYLLKADSWIFHNINFDIRFLCNMFAKFPDLYEIFIDKLRSIVLHDTLTLSHVWHNLKSHSLKDLALVLLGIPDDDKEKLKKSVEMYRGIAFGLSYKIASKENLPYYSRAPKTGWWVLDMWLPGKISQGEDTTCHEYAKTDAIRTMGIWLVLSEVVKKDGLWEQYEWRKKVLPTLYDAETTGLYLNQDNAKDLYNKSKIALERYTTKLRELVGDPEFDYGSYIHKTKYIYDVCKVEPYRFTKKAKKPSTDKDMLIDLIKMPYLSSEPNLSEACIYMYGCNKFSKIMSTIESFLKTKDKDSIVHTKSNLTGTKNIRLSTTDPGTHNISKGKNAFLMTYLKEIGRHQEFPELEPKELSLRRIFGPPPGYEWLSSDGKQIQLVIFANVSKEKLLIQMFLDGIDMHDGMSKIIFNLPPEAKVDDDQRTIGKNTNFGFIFGASEGKLNDTAKMPGLYKILETRIPNAVAFLKTTAAMIRKQGYIKSSCGYRFYIPKNKDGKIKDYAGVNYLVMADEAFIIQTAMVTNAEHLASIEDDDPKHAKLILNVHDELIYQFRIGTSIAHVSRLEQGIIDAGKLLGMTIGVDSKLMTKSWISSVKVKHLLDSHPKQEK